MIKKLIIASVLSTCLSLFTNAQASLFITNHTTINNISARCTGPMPARPIGSGRSINLSWHLVKTIIGSNPNGGSCSFFNGSRLEATAAIRVSAGLQQATLLSITKEDPNLMIEVTPGIGIESSNISIIVSGT